MQFEVLFFDLDDTLYPPNTGLWEAIRNRIEKYLIEVMKFPPEIAPVLQKELFIKHGTTLRGLEEEYQVDAQEYLDFVHDVPLTDYLKPDPVLKRILSHYPQRKVIFTNADSGHANRVINALGLTGCIDKIIDVRDIHPYCKPQVAAFQKALLLAGIEKPQKCVMIDDTWRNLLSAKKVGMSTIQIGTQERNDGVDAAILTLSELPEILPAE